jgi:beta-barrel assembly-enhancing protease
MITNLLRGCIISIALLSPAQGQPSDHLQDSSQAMISASSWRKIRQHTRHYVLTSPQVVHDPVLATTLQTLGMTLVKHLDRVQYPYTFFLIKQDSINAFASLGNTIGVTRGLFLATQTESELAAVLAHEIAHSQQQHLLQNAQRQQQLRLPMLLATIGALGLSALNPSLGQSVLVAGAAGVQQNLLHYAQHFETEADQIGINLLQKTHYTAHAMADFFQRLQATERYYHTSNTLLRTHPMTATRLAHARDLTARHPHTANKDSVAYTFMRERLRVLSRSDLKSLLDDYALKLKQHPQHDASYYGAALALQKSGDYNAALVQLERMPHHAQHWLSQLAISELLAVQHPKKALRRIQHLARRYPNNYAIRYHLITQLITLNPAEAAHQARFALVGYRDDPRIWRLLARAESARHHQAQAYIAAAQAQRLLYNPTQAKHYLQQARVLAKKDHDLLAEIKALLTQISLQSSTRALN